MADKGDGVARRASTGGGEVKFATINCRGVGTCIRKISCVYEKIKFADIVCLQECYYQNENQATIFNTVFEPTFEIVHSFSTPQNWCSGIILLKNRNFLGKFGEALLEIQGRALAVPLTANDFTCLVIGVYAPSDGGRRIAFYDSLFEKLSDLNFYDYSCSVLMGDFNVCNSNLDRSHQTIDRRQGWPELEKILVLLNLHDVFRIKYPNTKFYTFFSNPHGTQSRIDRIYTTLNLTTKTSSYTLTMPKSDHKVFCTHCSTKNLIPSRGRGYWKLNTLLLQDETATKYVESIFIMESRFSNLYEFENWEKFKQGIQNYYKMLGKEKSEERRMNRLILETRVEEIHGRLGIEPNNIDLKFCLKKLEAELELLNQFYISQCMHSNYYKDFVSDKVSLSSAKSLQKKQMEDRHIYKLKKKTDGSVIENSREIVDEVKLQYENLFAAENISPDILEQFLDFRGLPKLSEEQKDYFEVDISEDEVHKAIGKFQGRKTPGLDGLPIEFYAKFRKFVVPILTKMYNSYLAEQKLSPSQYEGVISMLYKGKGERNIRENWRPLTMLNVDYKIFTKILSLRLEKVMNVLVHPDQTCSVPGRTIQDGILKIYNIIKHADEHDIEGLILSVDHKSAFDVIEWDYIFKTCEAFNFGSNFVNFLKIIYKPGFTKSSVVVNGFLSDKFNVYRGIRQGCPASALIYSMTAEVLANLLRQTTMIRGIPLAGENARLSKYADDTNLFLQNFQDVRRAMDIFSWHQKASGSRLSPSKTQILRLGKLRYDDPPARYAIHVVDELKIYGIFMNSEGMEINSNWTKAESRIQKLSNSFVPYGISVYGRIHTVQIYYLCMFWFVSNIISPPEELKIAAYKAMDRYLWYPTKKNVVRKEVIQAPTDVGGLGYPNIDIRVKVNRLMVLVKRISQREALSWQRSFDHFYERVRNAGIRHINRTNVPKFYKELRLVILQTNFRQDGNFIWFFGEKIATRSVTSKFVYKKMGFRQI